MFNEGISRPGDLIDLAVKYELVKKAGAWFSYKEDKIGQGREAAKQFLKAHPEVMDELDTKIRERAAGGGQEAKPEEEK